MGSMGTASSPGHSAGKCTVRRPSRPAVSQGPTAISARKSERVSRVRITDDGVEKKRSRGVSRVSTRATLPGRPRERVEGISAAVAATASRWKAGG
jgi:hypothetical protein